MNTSAVAQATPSAHAFTQQARDAIYHAIFSRSDVRGQFLPMPVPDVGGMPCSIAARNSEARPPWVTITKPIMKASPRLSPPRPAALQRAASRAE